MTFIAVSVMVYLFRGLRAGKVFFGLAIASSFILGLAAPAKSNDIEWTEVPEARESDPRAGTHSTHIGSNTIARTENSINFDLLFGLDNYYARVAGNCDTGWLTMIASGYYNNQGQLVITSEEQVSFDPNITAPNLALTFACSQ